MRCSETLPLILLTILAAIVAILLLVGSLVDDTTTTQAVYYIMISIPLTLLTMAGSVLLIGLLVAVATKSSMEDWCGLALILIVLAGIFFLLTIVFVLVSVGFLGILVALVLSLGLLMLVVCLELGQVLNPKISRLLGIVEDAPDVPVPPPEPEWRRKGRKCCETLLDYLVIGFSELLAFVFHILRFALNISIFGRVVLAFDPTLPWPLALSWDYAMFTFPFLRPLIDPLAAFADMCTQALSVVGFADFLGLECGGLQKLFSLAMCLGCSCVLGVIVLSDITTQFLARRTVMLVDTDSRVTKVLKKSLSNALVEVLRLVIEACALVVTTSIAAMVRSDPLCVSEDAAAQIVGIGATVLYVILWGIWVLLYLTVPWERMPAWFALAPPVAALMAQNLDSSALYQAQGFEKLHGLLAVIFGVWNIDTFRICSILGRTKAYSPYYLGEFLAAGKSIKEFFFNAFHGVDELLTRPWRYWKARLPEKFKSEKFKWNKANNTPAVGATDPQYAPMPSDRPDDRDPSSPPPKDAGPAYLPSRKQEIDNSSPPEGEHKIDLNVENNSRTAEQKDLKTAEQKDLKTAEQKDLKTAEQKELKTAKQRDKGACYKGKFHYLFNTLETTQQTSQLMMILLLVFPYFAGVAKFSEYSNKHPMWVWGDNEVLRLDPLDEKHDLERFAKLKRRILYCFDMAEFICVCLGAVSLEFWPAITVGLWLIFASKLFCFVLFFIKLCKCCPPPTDASPAATAAAGASPSSTVAIDQNTEQNADETPVAAAAASPSSTAAIDQNTEQTADDPPNQSPTQTTTQPGQSHVPPSAAAQMEAPHNQSGQHVDEAQAQPDLQAPPVDANVPDPRAQYRNAHDDESDRSRAQNENAPDPAGDENAQPGQSQPHGAHVQPAESQAQHGDEHHDQLEVQNREGDENRDADENRDDAAQAPSLAQHDENGSNNGR